MFVCLEYYFEVHKKTFEFLELLLFPQFSFFVDVHFWKNRPQQRFVPDYWI